MTEAKYREIPLAQSKSVKWKELSLDTGTAQSTLEVVKLPEHAGGFVYESSFSIKNQFCCNRYIYWKTSQCVLELVEESFDYTLVGNRLRIRFQQTAVLDGVGIFETAGRLIILVATVGSVHRLSFPHPSCFADSDTTKSIFSDCAPAMLKDYNRFNIGLAQPHTSCCWLGNKEEAVYVLGTNKSIFVVNFYPNHETSIVELRRSSSIGFLKDMIFRGKGTTDADEIPSSIVCHSSLDDFHVYSLSGDLNLRIWSYKRQECIHVENLSKWIQEGQGDNLGTTTGESPSLYRCVDEQGDLLLVAFSPRHSRFVLVRPICEPGGSTQCYNSGVIAAPESKLIACQVTPHTIWGMFVNRRNENVMTSYPLRWDDEDDDATSGDRPRWSHVIWTDRLGQVPQACPTGSFDAREIFTDRLFRQKLFSTPTLWKSLQIFTRRDNNAPVLSDLSANRLTEECLRAIETSIKKRLPRDATDEEVAAIVRERYECFYTFCVQYHEAGLKPLGFFVNPRRDSFVGIVKSDEMSFLYPCDELSTLILSRMATLATAETGVAQVIAILEDIEEEFGAAISNEFCDALYHHALLEEICEQLSVFAEGQDRLRVATLRQNLKVVRNLYDTLLELVNCLGVEGIQPTDTTPSLGFASLFRSATGTDFIASCVHQDVLLRYVFCQRLIFIMTFVARHSAEVGLSPTQANAIREDLLPTTMTLLRCYYVQLWCCETIVSVQGELISVCELVVRGDTTALTVLEDELPAEATWSTVVQSTVGLILRLLWCDTDGALAIPFVLMEHGLYTQLQSYIRLVSEWSNKNRGTLRYLLAHTFLRTDDVIKATGLFISCYADAMEEPYVRQQICGISKDDRLLPVWYFLKVIKQLEYRSDASDCIVRLANACLERDPPADQLPIIYALIFRHELLMNHIERACNALRQNPDEETQRDCLRQLVVVLCERSQYKTLVEFPHEELRKELVSIVESRARATDLVGPHRYYELLYASYIHTSNYRLAAGVMYEWGFRLSREVPGIDSLQLQASCFLNAINCLTLIGEENAWIVRPRADVQQQRTAQSTTTTQMMAPKRRSSGQHKLDAGDAEEDEVTIDVLSIEDVEKQLCLVQAWVELLQHEAKIVPPLTPHETVTHLVDHCCYNTAARICTLHDVPMEGVFESLASLCCKSVQVGVSESNPGFADPEWIVDNPEVVGDLPRTAWTLLKHFLEKYEKSTAYYRRVAETFMDAMTDLPPWFEASYRRKNYPELLRLYIAYNCLGDATKLSIEVINAALGVGKEVFGFSEAVTATSKPVWLPMSSFDQLLKMLQCCQHPRARELGDQLKRKLGEYFTQVERSSQLAKRLE